jgi:hypothetical protein
VERCDVHGTAGLGGGRRRQVPLSAACRCVGVVIVCIAGTEIPMLLLLLCWWIVSLAPLLLCIYRTKYKLVITPPSLATARRVCISVHSRSPSGTNHDVTLPLPPGEQARPASCCQYRGLANLAFSFLDLHLISCGLKPGGNRLIAM